MQQLGPQELVRVQNLFDEVLDESMEEVYAEFRQRFQEQFGDLPEGVELVTDGNFRTRLIEGGPMPIGDGKVDPTTTQMIFGRSVFVLRQQLAGPGVDDDKEQANARG